MKTPTKAIEIERNLFYGILGLIFLGSVFLLFLTTQLGDSPHLIVSDGNGYYAWVRSLFIDGDLDFSNDFPLLYAPDPAPEPIITPKGLVHNKYPIGLAILEIPGFFLGHFIALLTPFPADGISLPYQLSVAISLTAFVVGSFALFYHSLRHFGVNRNLAATVAITLLLSTNLIHYYAKQPTMAHGAGVAVLSFSLWLGSFKNLPLSITHRENCNPSQSGEDRQNPTFLPNADSLDLRKEKVHPLFSLFLGFIIGLLILLRNTNAVFSPFQFYLNLKLFKQKFNIIYCSFSFLATVSLQKISLWLLWGEWVIYPYKNEEFKQGIQGLFLALWGNSYGLFMYHPLYLLLIIINLIGLVKLKPYRGYFITILIAFFALVAINGSWGNFGDSFGHRAFIETLPLLGFGAALTLQSYSPSSTQVKQGYAIIGLLILLNFYLWLGYLLKAYPHNMMRNLAQVYLWLFSTDFRV
ncbi:hypothetical protein K4A83_15695 [Spirulina subsalsa FACHB-351]|uniref:Glycosyltransferase RgtA/B/C/D-like domain-containing protein n=1 Tax=Spirulina subsalsa FACHB-351 TaxID=234711 RepID=A0ABT3L9C8_9CYAN|nr:hypothetical protein [Spirulina subsalsa]MCW6037704.1 hypothetical protein [Spirulina subsalsa FACHB-351]